MKKVLILVIIAVQSVSAQTFNKVYNLIQANCTSCHNSSLKQGNLDLSGAVPAVYAALVNINPTNPAAVNHKDKLIVKGDPHHSFLLRKCNNGLDADNDIVPAEGNKMPNNTTSLAPKDIELIRQWILQGAPDTGDVVDTSVINKFYTGKGINGLSSPPPQPTTPGAFQVHLGKIFLPPSSESEYFIKYNLNLPDTVEVNRLSLQMAHQSHHFIIYKILPGYASSFSDGLRLQDPKTGANSSNGYNTLVNAWQTPLDQNLPVGTAYLWEKETVLDLNYHIFNNSKDSVLAMDVYIDVYTQPKTTPIAIMYSDLIVNQNISIPNDHQDHTFTSSYNVPSATNMWNVWLLSSHTHKYGKAFDIFLRTPDGKQGQQIFEGWFDTFYRFNQGYYDWEHPPIEMFSPLLSVNPRDGLIQKAVYNNYGSAPVQFGLTTKDEMMLYFVQYTIGKRIATGITDTKTRKNAAIAAYPNPFNNELTLKYTLDKDERISLQVIDIIGRIVTIPVNDEWISKGEHEVKINASEYGFQQGVYFVKLVTTERAEIIKVNYAK